MIEPAIHRLASSLPLYAVVISLAFGASLQAEDAKLAKSATPERIAELVGQLGSDEFSVRETATEELTQIGLPAFVALEAAGKDPDREVRYRSLRILGLIRHQDMQRRLEAFLAGKDDGDYQLPCWERFKKSYGDDAQSRTLFVEMQRADADLLQALEEGPQRGAEAVGQRTIQFQQALQLGAQQQASLGQVAATLFVSAEEDVSLPVQTMTMVLNQCFQQAYRDTLTNSPRRDLPRKMLGSIIRRSEGTAAYTALNVAYQLNLPEGIEPAVKLLNNPAQPYMLPQALMLVARSGDAAHLPAIEKLLDNKTMITRSTEANKKVTYELQVRDAALAAAVLLSKQELKAYFDGAKDQPQPDDFQQIFFNPRLIGFAEEQARTTANEKWSKYRADQRKPAAEAPPQP
jgi:HEAT repeat protein